MNSRSPRALIDTPPVWLVLGIGLAWAQTLWAPLWPSPPVVIWVGIALIVAAAVLFVAAMREFRRHRTTIVPREVPVSLLTAGPYAWSRNPIYLADALILTGLVLTWDAAALWVVAAFVAVIGARFIPGEEAGCARVFGAAWQAYAARVRRWL